MIGVSAFSYNRGVGSSIIGDDSYQHLVFNVDVYNAIDIYYNGDNIV